MGWRAPRVRFRIAALVILCSGFALLGLSQGGNRIWARYEPDMQDPVDDAPDALHKGELARGGLRYRSPMDHPGRRYMRWGIDANKADRLLIVIVRRLTRV